MKKINLRNLLSVLVLLVLSVFVAAGCKPAVCSQMVRCCEEVIEVEGVGAACGPMAKELSNEATCESVLQTIGYMMEDRQQELPQACRM